MAKLNRETVVKMTEKFLEENKLVQSLEWRRKLVHDFTEDLIVQLMEDGHQSPDVLLQRWTMIHPDFIKKNSSIMRYQSILKILSDYMLDVKQWKENMEAEYPIHKDDKQYRREKKGVEVALVLDGEEDDGVNWYAVSERSFNVRNSVEAEIFKEDDASSVEGLRNLILQTKKDPIKFIRRYANPSHPWNNKKIHLKRTSKRVRAAIKNLDLDRVVECRVCGGAFYRHDLRQEICDTVPHPEYQKFSICQYLNNLYYNKNSVKASI